MDEYDRKLLQQARLQIMHAQALLTAPGTAGTYPYIENELEVAHRAICTVLKNNENKNVD